MKNPFRKSIIVAIIYAMATFLSVNAEDAAGFANGKHFVGGDISMLPENESAGAKYKDHSGKPISDVLTFFKDEGMNAMRVRVFVNPEDYTGKDADPNACQTIESVLPLCQRIKNEGLALVLDFHYSDTWADPAKQYTPKAWANLTDEELYVKIYEYTKESLETLKTAGVTPDFIQPGNEISYGMLWGPEGTADKDKKKCVSGNPANWTRLGELLNNAIKACREVCPDAGIVIHTERASNVKVQKNFYQYMKSLKVDYDIIGLSYYPYYHGNLSVLDAALNELETDFSEKNIMIVETGYSYKWEVPGTDKDVDYDYSDAGQNQFAKELVALLEQHPVVDGLFWWWMEYNAYGTSLSGWYNAPLFDSTTGRATSALKTICSFANTQSGVEEIEISDNGGMLPPEGAYPESADPEKWYDLQGRHLQVKPQVKGIYILNGKKIVL